MNLKSAPVKLARRIKAQTKPRPQPPAAPRHDHTHVTHGDAREDPFYWLRERNNPEVTHYLNAENAYAQDWLARLEPLREELVSEMYDRVVETDSSVPVKLDQYEYFSKDRQQDDYRSHWRRHLDRPDTDELLLNENELAAGHKYFDLESLEVSPNHYLMGYATDFKGDEIYTIEVLDLQNRTLLADRIDNASGNFVWSQDSRSIYYTTLNSMHRPYRVYRHRLGTDRTDDELVFEELDEAFYVSLSASDSRKFIQIEVNNKITSEVYLLDTFDNEAMPQSVLARRADIRYEVQDYGDSLYILTNDDAVNFRLVKTRLNNPDRTHWVDVVPAHDRVTLTGFAVFKDFIALEERRDGLPTVRVLTHEADDGYLVNKPPKIQELRLGPNWEFDTSICRLGGNALDMPYSSYDLDMATGETTHLKTQPVGGHFDPTDYVTEKHLAQSHEGEAIPIYLVYNRNATTQKPAPLLLYGYGSYGLNSSLYFSSRRLSLLDRGIIFAITQIRGGSEMGRSWYLNGKLDKKKNTFYDFHACADYLLANEITSPQQMAIMGGSAGGLVVGHFLNSDRQQCKAALALVPFVDIVTTILDDTLPLSIVERDEWGDPNDPAMYEYMKSYSPYDNVRSGDYPALYITGGLNDSRVGFWEPAKWAARIRQCKTDDNPVLLVTEMDSGHSGASGRLDSLRDTAREYAFIVDQLLPDPVSQ